jgi:hypothetical protein
VWVHAARIEQSEKQRIPGRRPSEAEIVPDMAEADLSRNRFSGGIYNPQLEITLANLLDVPPRLVHHLAPGFVNPIEKIRPRHHRPPATGHDQSGANRGGLSSEELSPGQCP